MKYPFLLSALFLYSMPIHTMEATEKNILIQHQDVWTHHVAPTLNRIDRTSLCSTCSTLKKAIQSQHELNMSLKNAFQIKNTTKITLLRSLGALYLHEELFKAIPEQSPKLATWIIKNYKSQLSTEHKNMALTLAKNLNKKSIIILLEPDKSACHPAYYPYPGGAPEKNPSHQHNYELSYFPSCCWV